MVGRPENHVTRTMAARAASLSGTTEAAPSLTLAQIEKLEALFPPRCLAPDETVEHHLRYAGKVELVQALRAAFEAAEEAKRNGDEVDPDEDPIDGEWAGR